MRSAACFAVLGRIGELDATASASPRLVSIGGPNGYGRSYQFDRAKLKGQLVCHGLDPFDKGEVVVAEVDAQLDGFGTKDNSLVICG